MSYYEDTPDSFMLLVTTVALCDIDQDDSMKILISDIAFSESYDYEDSFLDGPGPHDLTSADAQREALQIIRTGDSK